MGKILTKQRDLARNPNMRFLVLGLVLGLCLAFVAVGAAFIPYAGIQDDEGLFASPIYQHMFEFGVRIHHHVIPLMLMTYIGTLKTFLYWPILRIFPAGPYAVRLPMVLVGSITIFVFFFLSDKLSGRRAAWIATVLLATDPIFLLTDTFDWGPVALEHFLLVTGIFALVKYSYVEYHQEAAENHRWLAAGFLCLGLALWNKAIFLWMLAGIIVAAAAVCHKEIRGMLTWRRAGIAAAAFIVGSSPFVLYNIRHTNATLRASANLEIPDWNAKFLQVRLALNGSSLSGFLISDDTRERPKIPVSRLGRLAVAVRRHFGEHLASLGDYAALACLLAAPLWWPSRAARFSLLACGVAWLVMAVTKGAGGAAHHVVLLWPFPQLFIGITLAALPQRKLAGLFAASLIVSNLLVINQYFLQIQWHGPGPTFTDAIYGLSAALRSHAAETVYVTDWGMYNPLAVLNKGLLHLEVAVGDFNKDDLGEPERNHIAQMAADRNAVFIGHVAGEEIFPGSRERTSRAAESVGLRKQVVQIVADSNGRPTFEIFRWTPPPNSPISR